MTQSPTPLITGAEGLPPYIYGREAGPNEKVWTQAAVDSLRSENERLSRELEKVTFSMGGWKEMLWAVARELNCLPSTFWDGNAHVVKAAINLNAELAALKAGKDRP